MYEWAINKCTLYSLVSIFDSFGGSFVVAEFPEAVGTRLQQIVRVMRHLLSILYHSREMNVNITEIEIFIWPKQVLFEFFFPDDSWLVVVCCVHSSFTLHFTFFSSLFFPKPWRKINGILSSIKSHICAIFEDLIESLSTKTQFYLNTWLARKCSAPSFTICNIFSLMLIRRIEFN